jgi:predicted amidohydrolase
MRVYLSRWVCLDVESNLRRLAEETAAAAQAGATWAVFPESFLHGYRRQVEPRRVRERFASISAQHPDMVCFFGSFTEEGRNRMTVWRGGGELARYDKVHLFAPNDEEALWDPGDRYVAVDLDGLRVGLLNCNDLRFPEQARALRLAARCTVLVVPGWWPWRRDHVWRTLLAARAIENGVWTLGCAVAASEWPGESFAGAGCHVFDPHGEPVRTIDDRTYDLDLERTPDLLVDPRERFVAIDTVEVQPRRGTPPIPPTQLEPAR